MKGHERPPTFMRYNRDDDLLFSRAKDHTPTIWYACNNDRLGTYCVHNNVVWSCNVSTTTGGARAPARGRRHGVGEQGGRHSLLHLCRILRPLSSPRPVSGIIEEERSAVGESSSTRGRGALPRLAPAHSDLTRLLTGVGGWRRGRAMLIHRWSSKRGSGDLNSSRSGNGEARG
jgi:hypothetical protein